MKLFTSSLALTLLSVISLACAEEVDFDPTRLEVSELAAELVRPMELAVASDRRVFFVELDGLLKCYDPQSNTVTTVAELEVFNEQENGLIGLALDPNFDQNHHLFLHYSPPNFPGQHISRFTLDGDKLDLSSEKILLKFEEQRLECCHHSGSLQFGPDGNLFIGTGDNTHPGGDSQGYAPIDEREGKAPWDAQKSAANTHQLSGKILRIKPTAEGTYEIPEGNLFPADGNQGRPEIYVMGCRNPWRLNVDQRTGYVYWGEVGPDAHNPGKRGPRGYDEVNQARAAGNFGWPYFIANNLPYSDVDFATQTVGRPYVVDRPVNQSPNNTGSEILPPAQPAFIYYPYAASKEFPELGQGGRTACAGPVYHYDQNNPSTTKFPKHFDNTLFIFEWTRHWIKAVKLDKDSKIKSIKPFMGTRQFQRPIDIEFGQDGAMYMLEYGETWGVNKDAKLIRIDYVAGNRKPKAVANVANNVGREPLSVTFSAKGSYDKDDDHLSYQWTRIDTSDDGKRITRTPLSSDPNPNLTFTKTGAFNVELKVDDGNGGSDQATVAVLVGNAKPTIQIRDPVGGFFEPGETIQYEIIVNDHEDGTNDLEIADKQGLPEIDAESWQRVSMNIKKMSGKFSNDQDTADPPGLRLMKKSDCFNCHDISTKRVGPPLVEISERYRNDPHAISRSVDRVLQGSTGVWGKVPMVPHQQHTNQEVHNMVSWVFDLRAEEGIDVIRGFVGEINTDKKQTGGYQLDAIYKDRGTDIIPALTSTASIRLRSRHLEAEHADEIKGPSVFENEKANNQKFAGSINHNHYLRYDSIDLAAIRKISCRVSSEGKGGIIEFRRGALDGPLLAKTVVNNTGDWNNYEDLTADFPSQNGIDDLYIVFVNEQNRQALMNLDSMYFHSN